MNELLENKLYKDFPELFQEHTLDMSQTCMCWGLEVGDGWEPVIRNMCELLKSNASSPIIKKPRFPYQYELEVWFHNKCRKIERLLRVPYGKLYQCRFERYVKFKGFGVKFTQVKEKFGTLRVYYDVYNRYSPEEVKNVSKKTLHEAYLRYVGYVDGVISFATELSEHTCESHGKPGKLNTKGWWKVRCEDCIKPKINENTSNS